MTITTRHPSSSHGLPVVLDDKGEPMDPAVGVKAARHRLGWTVAEAADRAGKNGRSITHYESGHRPPPADYLNLLSDALTLAGT
jgi:DNA-binding XRE family transcriptional regulator